MNRYYFDHNATTPVASEVLDVLTAALREDYGNASSIHFAGQRAKQALEQSRTKVAAALGVSAAEIVFTSGGTEANNLAIQGVVRKHGGVPHVVTTAIEHPAVLEPCRQLEQAGVARLSVVPCNAQGVVDAEAVKSALREDTVLVSVMHANNETGAMQPVAEIAAMLRGHGALLHVDGVQAAGRVPVNLRELGVDLYSVSGHKLHAPKGTGALYVRKGVELAPLLTGGRHERNRRAGTENVPGAVALAHAFRLATEQPEAARIAGLRDRLERGILASVPDTQVQSSAVERLPNTTNILFRGVEGEALVIALDLRGFAVSSGAACSSGAVEPSHVLLALGLEKQDARSCLRFSLGRENSEEQVDALIQAVQQATAHLRRIAGKGARLEVAHV